ncbi:MAG: hypothetical protein ACJ8CC_14115, partial [Microvirga sp.]
MADGTLRQGRMRRGLSRRGLAPLLAPLAAALGAVAALGLYFSPGWRLTDTSDFGYFGYPAETFMGRVVLVKLAHGVSGKTAAALLVGVALVAVVALATRPRWRRLLPLALLPAALFQLANS